MARIHVGHETDTLLETRDSELASDSSGILRHRELEMKVEMRNKL